LQGETESLWCFFFFLLNVKNPLIMVTVKSTGELLAEAKASVESWGKKVDEVDGEVETNRKKVHFKAAEAHLLSKSLNDQDPYK
jgi:hypothetical protein